jgi:lysophospholipase L1-like esterase
MRRGAAGRLLGKALLLVVSGALALTGADLVVRTTDLGFQPVRNRPHQNAELVRAEFRTRVVTNALGFRDRRLPGPKAARTMRVVIVGDSFAQGYGVEETEAFPWVLERILGVRDPQHRYEVINLGVQGACPLDYLANLRDVGLDYEPDLVVVALMANDVNDLRSIREYGGRMLSAVLHDVQKEITDDRPIWKRLPRRLWPSLYDYAGNRLRFSARGPEAFAGVETDREKRPRPALPEDRWRDVLLRLGERYDRRPELEAALAKLPPRALASLRSVLTGQYRYEHDGDQRPMLGLMSLMQPRVFADMVLLSPEYDAAWNETTRLLRRMDALARGAGAKTLIAFVPAAYQVSEEAWQAWVDAGFVADRRTLSDTTLLDRVKTFGADAGVPVVDLLTPLRARANDELYFPIDGHWTPLGHRVAARVLADTILGD